MKISNNSFVIKNSSITSGNGDIIIGGVKITNIFESFDYQTLHKRIQEWEGILNVIPDENSEQNYLVKRKIAELKNQENDLIQTVNNIASIFNRIEISSEKLKLAKEYFEKGKYRQVHEILDPDLMMKEQLNLIELKSKGEKNLQKLNKQLLSNAQEFLIKAKTTFVDFDNKNRYNEVIWYYESSLRSYPLIDTRMLFIEFLMAHGAHEKAKKQFSMIDEESLKEYDLPHQAIVKGNLGLLYMQEGNYSEAQKIFESVKEIFKSVVSYNPEYLYYQYIGSINNLAVTYVYQDNREKAIEFFNESINLFNAFNPTPNNYLYYYYLSEIASTYNNLGRLYISSDCSLAIKFLLESISNYTEAYSGSRSFRRELASAHFNLATAQMQSQDNISAEENYKQTVAIHSTLLKEGIPNFGTEYITYLNSYAMCLVQLGKLELAVDFFREAFFVNNYMHRNQLLDLYENNLLEELLRFDSFDLVKSLNGISIFYRDQNPNRDVSIHYAEQAQIQFFKNLAEFPNEINWSDYQKSFEILKSWEIQETS